MNDDITAATKIRVYEIEFPEVRTGKQRGAFEHVAFAQRWCKRTHKDDYVKGKMTDLQEFAHLQNKTRGWQWAEAERRFNYLRSLPGAEADEGGE